MTTDKKEVIGIMSLTYNNVIVWCTDRATWDYLSEKIKRNMKRAGVVLKVSSIEKVHALHMFIDDHPWKTFCGSNHPGVQIGLARTESNEMIMKWRHDPKRVEKWRSLSSSDPITRRDAARRCGVILWHLTVSLTPLCYSDAVLAILSQVAKIGAGMPHVTYKKSELSEILDNSQPRVSGLRGRDYVLFTDASKDHMGAVLCDNTEKIVDVFSASFPAGMQDSYIYLKEVSAAVFSAWSKLVDRSKQTRAPP